MIVEMMHTIQWIAAAVVLGTALDHLNRITRSTSFAVRISYIALAVGGFGLVIDPFFAPMAFGELVETWKSQVMHTLLILGLAVSMLADRRRQGFQERRRHERRHAQSIPDVQKADR